MPIFRLLFDEDVDAAGKAGVPRFYLSFIAPVRCKRPELRSPRRYFRNGNGVYHGDSKALLEYRSRRRRRDAGNAFTYRRELPTARLSGARGRVRAGAARIPVPNASRN